MQATGARATTRGQLAAKLRAAKGAVKVVPPETSPRRKRNEVATSAAKAAPQPVRKTKSDQVTPGRRFAARRAIRTGGDDTAAATIASPARTTPKKRRSVPTAAIVTQELQAKADRIRKELDTMYGMPAIPLDHSTPFQLLIAVILSAQVRLDCAAR